MQEIGEDLIITADKKMLLALQTTAQIHQTTSRRPITDILKESFPEAATEKESLSPVVVTCTKSLCPLKARVHTA